jgi:hypothetical protein
MHRRIDGGSPEPAFVGPMIRQSLARDSSRCRVAGGVVDRPTIGGDYRSGPGMDSAAVHGPRLASAARPGC